MIVKCDNPSCDGAIMEPYGRDMYECPLCESKKRRKYAELIDE